MSEDGALLASHVPLRWGHYLSCWAYMLCCALIAWSWVGPGAAGVWAAVSAALASYVSWRLGERVWGWGAERWRRAALMREHARRLKGVEPARVEAVERAFWLEAQRDVLVARRVRDGVEPRVLGWREALLWHLRRQHLTLVRFGVLVACGGLFVLALCKLALPQRPAMELLCLAAILPCAMVALLGGEVWVTRRSRLDAAWSWASEQRMLGELVSLAGEQVAEDDVEAALVVWREEQPEPLDPDAAIGLFLFFVTGFFIYCILLYPLIAPLFYLGRAASRRRVASRVMREQRARLAVLLVERGVAALEPTDRQRVEVEQRFWSEEQARSAEALRARFKREPAALSLRGALSQRLRSYRSRLKVWALIAPTALVAGASVVWLFGWELGVTMLVGLSLALFLGAMMAFGLLIESFMVRSRRVEQRRIFTTERRRIAQMAELAGGLTLAESMDEDALVGALSVDGALVGALSGVEL
jgi:hypothetical protein